MTEDGRPQGAPPSIANPVHPRSVYRLLSVLGVACVTALAVGICFVANRTWLPVGQELLGSVGPTGPSPNGVVLAMVAGVTVLGLLPLCKPDPRRILDTVTKTVRAVVAVVAVIATTAFFAGIDGVPRVALLAYGAVLLAALSPTFVALQEWYLKRNEGTLIVGNNPERLEAAVQAAAEPIVGYAFSPTDERGPEGRRVDTDGGQTRMPPKLAQYECLGGLTRLDAVLERSNVGTVIPALPQTDRAEFFGVLETCHRHDVNVDILSEHNESVLVGEESGGPSDRQQRLIGINMEPLDLQNRVTKRLFDVVFAVVGLLVTLPLLAGIALAVKCDGPGPVFYRQRRTSQFGDTFPVYKFRTMRPASESATPGEESDRVTRVGRFLRRTHLDELPQLWSILLGHMSVVGPRAAWTAEEELLQDEMGTWKKRWFVKPGLTGLAQINEVSSENSRAKLQYDLTYIRNQSFWFDSKILVRQCWMVCLDLATLARRAI